jgi:hypothetical protein
MAGRKRNSGGHIPIAFHFLDCTAARDYGFGAPFLEPHRAELGAQSKYRKEFMMRNLKALGLALFAVLALGALAVASASAAGEQFHADVEPSVLTGTNEGEGNHVFKAGEAEVVCTTAKFAGTTSTKTTTSQNVHPTYSGCTFLGSAATVDTAGCNYVLSSEVGAGGVAPVEISCTGTNKIKVTGAGCTLSFGSQLTEGGATYKTLATTPKTVTSTSNTKATFTKSGLLCGAVTGTVGTYTGSVITKTYEDKGGPTNEDEYTEGAQVNGWWE